MSGRALVTADDLRESAALCAKALFRLEAGLWDELAFGLDWARSRTIVHIGDALGFYATSLAARVRDKPEIRGLRLREGSIPASASQVVSGAGVLARVAEGTPPGVRAYHASGLPDAEGFLAMGCVEILVHGHDTVAGTGAGFGPDNDLCERVLKRLFPWAPTGTPGWPTLLWATGRGGLEGREPVGETWMWHSDLPGEWGGAIPSTNQWVGRK